MPMHATRVLGRSLAIGDPTRTCAEGAVLSTPERDSLPLLDTITHPTLDAMQP